MIKYVKLKKSIALYSLFNTGDLCEEWMETLINEWKPHYGLMKSIPEERVNEYLEMVSPHIRKDIIEWLKTYDFVEEVTGEASYYTEEDEDCPIKMLRPDLFSQFKSLADRYCNLTHEDTLKDLHTKLS